MAADFSVVRLAADTSAAVLLAEVAPLAGAALLEAAGHPAEAVLPGNSDNACYKSCIINLAGCPFKKKPICIRKMTNKPM